MAHVSQVQHYNEPVEKQLGFAAIVQTGKILHLAGIVAVDDALNVVGQGDMAAQVERVYDIMETTLAKSGATLLHVVNEMIFVTDLRRAPCGRNVMHVARRLRRPQCRYRRCCSRPR